MRRAFSSLPFAINFHSTKSTAAAVVVVVFLAVESLLFIVAVVIAVVVVFIIVFGLFKENMRLRSILVKVALAEIEANESREKTFYDYMSQVIRWISLS